MKLSACYIVKNEERVLQASMESLAESVDEFIVVDTGSQDSTLRIAGRFGADVSYFPWQDDFSGPRNAAIERATGDWIVFLDADEFLSAETRRNLRTFLGKLSPESVDGLAVPLRNIDTDHGNRLLLDSFALRIFPRREELRFCGRIHEELRKGGRPLSHILQLLPQELQIIHTGYSNEIAGKKAARNLRLLRQELRESCHPERVYGYLADAYLGLGNVQEAEKYAYLDIQSGARKNSSYASRSYRILLQLLAYDGTRTRERREVCRMAVEDFPHIPEFSADLAECEAAMGDIGQAIVCMRQALAEFRAGDGSHGWEPSMFTAEMAEMAQRRMEAWQGILERKEDRKMTGSVSEVHHVTTQVAGEQARQLFLAMLCLTERDQAAFRESVPVLPGFLAPLALRYFDADRKLGEEDAEGYGIALGWVLDGAGAEVQERFLALAADFSAGILRKLADGCLLQAHEEAAFLLYGRIAADAPEADAVFWRNVGICFYRAGEKETAMECFVRARDMGLCRDGAIETYLLWCGKGAGENA